MLLRNFSYGGARVKKIIIRDYSGILGVTGALRLSGAPWGPKDHPGSGCDPGPCATGEKMGLKKSKSKMLPNLTNRAFWVRTIAIPDLCGLQ